MTLGWAEREDKPFKPPAPSVVTILSQSLFNFTPTTTSFLPILKGELSAKGDAEGRRVFLFIKEALGLIPLR